MTMSFTSPRLEPEREQPVQYTEPLPDWVRAELELHRDKLPELRAAICKAVAKTKGVLKKSETNKEQGYKYAGFDALIEGVREVMAEEGVTIDQVSCDIEAEIQFTTRSGGVTVWKWRAICLVTHSSGAAMCRIVRTLTSPGNKAAGIARTAIDRTLLTTLMRMAGGRDEALEQDPGARAVGGDQRNREHTRNNSPGRPPAQNAPGQTTQNGAKAQHKDWTPEALAQAKEWADRAEWYMRNATTRARMVSWARIVNGTNLPKVERERLTTLWRTRCAELEQPVEELKKDVARLGPLPWARVAMETATGDMHDKEDGTLL